MDEQDKVYLQFDNFDFLNFPEYQEGLGLVFESYIFQHNENLQPGEHEITDISQVESAIKQQLTLQAQVYFFCEKTENILSLDDYFEWKHKHVNEKGDTETPKVITNEEKSTLEPPYSSNYEKIVDLIVHGKPVPGIKDIPDVINEEPVSKQALQLRKKPWETGVSNQTGSLLNDEKFISLLQDEKDV